jgi:hypothetical protein
LVETKGENKINFPQSKGDGKFWTKIQSLSGFHQAGETNQCVGLIFLFSNGFDFQIIAISMRMVFVCPHMD